MPVDEMTQSLKQQMVEKIEHRFKVAKAQRLAKEDIIKAPSTFKNANIDDLLKICNGCGAAGSSCDLVPDKIWGTDISPACNAHDFMWHEGKDKKDKIGADKVFRSNLYALIDLSPWYKPKPLMKIRAYGYYLGVRYLPKAKKAFWKDKLRSE